MLGQLGSVAYERFNEARQAGEPKAVLVEHLNGARQFYQQQLDLTPPDANCYSIPTITEARMIDAPRPTTTPYPSLKLLVNEIRNAAAAWFASRDLPTHAKHGHVLGKSVDWHENLILPEVRTYIDTEIANADRKVTRRSPFALNGAISNGASSQAMAFNLVGPLIARGDLGPLREVIEKAGVPWPTGATASFEIESRIVFNEQHGQPTSIDLVVNGDSPDSPPIMIEVKLTESGFGGCSVFAKGQCDTKGANPLPDLHQCYLHRKGYTYWQRMAEYGLLPDLPQAGSACALVFDYQFYRELLFALYHSGYFVLLHDARSPVFMGTPTSSLPRLLAQLPAQLRDRVASITVQEVVATIRASRRHNDWIEAFEAKYGLSHSLTGCALGRS